jgi:hypothetical protein
MKEQGDGRKQGHRQRAQPWNLETGDEMAKMRPVEIIQGERESIESPAVDRVRSGGGGAEAVSQEIGDVAEE